MKNKIHLTRVAIRILLMLTFALNFAMADEKPKDAAWQALFNGKDLSNWDIVIGQRGPTLVNEDPDKIFQVHDGMVHTYKDTVEKSVVQYGYFLTKKKYSHYHLRFEFKWGAKKFEPRLKAPRDAGVLYHVVGGKKVWPRSLELQVEENGMGDFLTVYGAQVKTTVDPQSIDKKRKGNARFRLPEEGGVPHVTGGPGVYWVYRYPEAAKEGWNTFELIVRGSESAEHKVNGVVVNRVTDLKQLDKDGKTWIPLEEGKILFQAEAAEAFYRNIEIKELGIPEKEVAQAEVSKPEFFAGASVVDVTPEILPAIHNGGFTQRTIDKVRDRLHSRSFILKTSEETVAIAVVDSCMIPRDLCHQAKVLASKKTGIPVNRILISSTHTHSAPSVMNLCLGSSSDPNYEKFLPPKIAEGIVMAFENLEPARIGVAVVDAPEHTHCRRWLKHPDKYAHDPFGEKTVRAMMHPGYQNPDYIGPAGPVDTGLSLLSIQSADGKRPIGLLGNYSMHYFGVGGGVSADYYGMFCDLMKEKIAITSSEKPPFVAAMSQGTSGDLHWMDYSKPAKKKFGIGRYTAELAGMAFDAYQEIEYKDSGALLAMAETTITLDRRLASKERIAWAKKLNTERGDRRPANRPEVYAEQVAWFQENPTEDLILQVVRIGDAAITALPNEVYGITGLKLKAQSPFEVTFNMGLANGAAGYIPPPEQHYLGGYTTWPARTAGLEVNAEPKIVDALLGMLEKLSGQPRKPLTDDFYNDQQREAFQKAKADENNRANRGVLK